MRFDDRFLDEIKSRLRLSDVIGRSVKLRRSGREFVGLSPFGKEKTPSFYVNDEKGFFHDFSTGKHGDLISFLQETERLTFPEAVERLAAEAGVPMPAIDPRAAEAEAKRYGLTEWMDLAAKWFEAQLRRPVGEGARAYLAKRALPEADWARFSLGYAPSSRTGLRDYLVAKGAKPAELVEAGLLIAPEGGTGAPYDRFRDRIIFPIADGRGRVVSFGGRALDPEAKAKYLNGPETTLFHKGTTLYGLPEARKILHAAQTKGASSDVHLVVVEGYMDVLACQRSEIAAVAPMGTALTEEQMELLWRLHPEPTLCFDADKAGVRAAWRSLDRALPKLKPGKSLRFAIVSGGKDPDDVLREQGPAALRAQVSQTKPFVDVLFERELGLQTSDTPEKRAGLKVRLRQAATMIEDKDLAEQYRVELLDRFSAAFPRKQFLPGWGKRLSPEDLRLVINRNAAQILKERAKRLNAAVAVMVVRNPEWALPYVEEIAAYGFGDAQLDKLKKPILEAVMGEEVDSTIVKAFIRHHGVQGIFDKALRIARETPPITFTANEETEELAHHDWALAIEAIVELAAIKTEVAHRAPVGEANDYIERRRVLRGRRLVLERELNDISIWTKVVEAKPAIRV